MEPIKMICRVKGLILAFVASCALAATPACAAPMPAPAGLATLQADRAQWALALSKPIAVCVAKHDTDNPVFHGCIDWHSSVHGVWALTAYTWATKDPRYKPLIASLMQPALLAKERKNLDADPQFEMPYGRSWFLRLAMDYRRTFGTNALDAFGDDVAASLMTYYAHVRPDPKSIAYDSATWALINLYDYGVARNDARIVAFVRDDVRKYYLANTACPLQTELDSGEFMAICTNWAWLVGETVPRAQFERWLAVFFADPRALDPVTDPATVHQEGLNFSRAWGLWNVYRQTGDPRYFMAYLRHFNETYGQPKQWDGEYDLVAHWIPQFGMLALIVTYYDWP
jgi:hypothetical protein